MRRERPKPDMNVTPLVDVVLVLLIIFMVVMPQMEAGAAVDLPAVRNADPAEKLRFAPLTLSVTPGGGFYVEKERVEMSAMDARLAVEHAATPNRRIIVKGDRAARYADVRMIFKMCQSAGFPGVAIQVGERRKEGK